MALMMMSGVLFGWALDFICMRLDLHLGRLFLLYPWKPSLEKFVFIFAFSFCPVYSGFSYLCPFFSKKTQMQLLFSGTLSETCQYVDIAIECCIAQVHTRSLLRVGKPV